MSNFGILLGQTMVVIEAIERQPSILGRLKRRPDQHVVGAAAEQLRTQLDIRQFVEEYLEEIKSESANGHEESRVKHAVHNMGYLLGFFADNVRHVWSDALHGHLEFETFEKAIKDSRAQVSQR